MSDTPTDRITVRIRDRAAEAPWGVGLTSPRVVDVEISANCPTCQSPRGERRRMRQHDDGVDYYVDVWSNPCDHTDNYARVAQEARQLAAST